MGSVPRTIKCKIGTLAFTIQLRDQRIGIQAGHLKENRVKKSGWTDVSHPTRSYRPLRSIFYGLDQVALYRGARIPLIVTQERRSWRLVGDNYIHGIRYREAFDPSKREGMWLI